MPVTVRGVPYLPLGEVADEVDVSRQTLWRWRKEGLIPQGGRGRGRMVLFSPAEVQAIRDFAFRVEPIFKEDEDSVQGSLFDRDGE